MEWRTAFVGREREIDSVRSLLGKTRLLTLTGAGGIGKTRLALEVVQRSPGEFQGDVVTVELASVRDPEQLLAAISARLGFRDMGAVDPVHVLSERLGRTRTLLLLDNFEQIVSAAPRVGELLDATPSLVVVVTSRVALHLSGEQEYTVPPLELPTEASISVLEHLRATEAIALFTQRAGMVRPDFELTPANAGAVADICRRLDGLPLAIELAASRLKVLTPEALLKRLGQRLAILTGGAADAPERQRTLRATIAWSYELLPPRERAQLLRCAVFVGGFTIEAARAICPDDEAQDGLLDELGLLVDHNLLTASTGEEGEPRFGMLETIREFAIEEMDGREYEAIRRRHAQHFTELADAAGSRLQGLEHATWLARLTNELANLRVALAWTADDGDAERFVRLAAAMAPYWRYYGDIREGRRWLGAALTVSETVSLNLRAKVTRAAGWLEAVAGNLTYGEQLLNQSLRLYERVGDEGEVATTLYHLGSTLLDLDRRTAASRRLERGLALARKTGAAATEARLLLALAWQLGNSNRQQERGELIRQAIDASVRAGDLQRLALSLATAGWDAWDSGDQRQAITHWAESVALLRQWGERAFLGSILLFLSYGHLRLGEREAARPPLLEAIQLMRQVGAVPDIITALSHVADWLLANEAPGRALVLWRAAEVIRQRHGFDEGLVSPLKSVREALRATASVASLTVSPEATPISIEEALDVAERDVAAIAIMPGRGQAAAAGSRFDLTPREREVLELVVAGRSNAEIGEALYISRKTASVHVANIKDKLGAQSRIGIATMAIEGGLIPGAAVAPDA
jgi:predicted ATPase/DNA-binding CsgD family transcriptional regulator